MALEKMIIDEEKIKKAVQSGIPLIITTYTLPHEVELYIEKVLTSFLKHSDQERLKDYMIYCVLELVENARKANTKRVYFAERGLDLNNPGEYEQGMAGFREDTLNNLCHYLQIQKQEGLYIRLLLKNSMNVIDIEVRNNAVITQAERARIQNKLVRSRRYTSLEDAMVQVLDDLEGAGLGLVILVLMLKKIGLGEDCFSIQETETETIARIVIPLDKTRVENLSSLSSTIISNIDSLPQFPENIQRVQHLIDDPNAEMAEIARQISMDPAMTADLLRVVNSAQFMLAKKVNVISDAVRMVGIRGIKNLLYSYGTQEVLGNDTLDKKALWTHSYKTAFYAYNLVKNFRKNHFFDDAYVGGILHDMGKIIFANVHPDLMEQIRKFCAEKSLPAATFEDLTAGMNHAEIGALMAEKWNFPDTLVCAIRFHHDPASAPPETRGLVEPVYLANMFCEYENGGVIYDQIDPEILNSFGIISKKQLDSLLKRFSSGFTAENTGDAE
jgi:putative nucleotidyltransferase with HDIG domain